MAIGIILLAFSLAAAVIRPRELNEAVVAVPCALLAVLSGAASPAAAWQSVRSLGSTVAFLGFILVFGQLCARARVFDYLGSLAARSSGGRPARLLWLTVVLAALVTATLTLDATVVLITPVVLATAGRLKLPARVHSYACAHIANSGSLLLPVSNLTNLLAFAASRLSFGRFAIVMAGPWLLACALDWAGLRAAFGRDLKVRSREPTTVPAAPRYALAVLGCTVAGFVLTSAVSLAPAWAALGGVVLLAGPALARREIGPGRLVADANPGFCAFVLCLGVLMQGILDHGARRALSVIVPTGTGYLAVVGLALVAATVANLANNLPATLALLPLVAGSPLAVLAILVGVNLGPNATYPGSLATLLWRRLLPPDEKPVAGQFHALGLLWTPPAIVAVASLLWLVAGPAGLR